MIERRTFANSGRELIGMGSKIRLTFLFLSYCTNKYSFQNFLWRPFKPSKNVLWCGRFIWGANLKIRNHRYDQIKYGANIFKRCYLVYLTSVQTNLDLEFFTCILMAIEFIKCTLICDRIFSIDINDPHIQFSLCWKLMTSWLIWYYISDIRNCKIFIIQ